MPVSGKSIYIQPKEILYCKADGNYTEIFLNNNKKEMLSKKIKNVEMLINNNSFYRVHNSYLVNIKYVKELVKTGASYLVLEDQTKIPISRSKKTSLIDLLNK